MLNFLQMDLKPMNDMGGAFTVEGAKAVIKCNVILYHVYFERQVCVMYLFKLLFIFAIIFIF